MAVVLSVLVVVSMSFPATAYASWDWRADTGIPTPLDAEGYPDYQQWWYLYNQKKMMEASYQELHAPAATLKDTPVQTVAEWLGTDTKTASAQIADTSIALKETGFTGLRSSSGSIVPGSLAEVATGIVLSYGLNKGASYLSDNLIGAPQAFYADGTPVNTDWMGLGDPRSWTEPQYISWPKTWLRDAKWDPELDWLYLGYHKDAQEGEFENGEDGYRSGFGSDFTWNAPGGILAYLNAPISIDYNFTGQEQAAQVFRKMVIDPHYHIKAAIYSVVRNDSYTTVRSAGSYPDLLKDENTGEVSPLQLFNQCLWPDGHVSFGGLNQEAVTWLVDHGDPVMTDPLDAPGIESSWPDAGSMPSTTKWTPPARAAESGETTPAPVTVGELVDGISTPDDIPKAVSDALPDDSPDKSDDATDPSPSVPSTPGDWISNTWDSVASGVIGAWNGIQDFFWPMHFMKEYGGGGAG